MYMLFSYPYSDLLQLLDNFENSSSIFNNISITALIFYPFSIVLFYEIFKSKHVITWVIE